jgi:hypothetical protein
MSLLLLFREVLHIVVLFASEAAQYIGNYRVLLFLTIYHLKISCLGQFGPCSCNDRL